MANIKFKDLTTEEKSYWSLLYILIIISNNSNMSINKLLTIIIENNDFDVLINCSFLLVTSNINKSINDLCGKYNIECNLKNTSFKEKTDELFLEIKKYKIASNKSFKEIIIKKYDMKEV